MQKSEVLQHVRERASALVIQDLRSAAIVIARLHELIVAAHRSGHSHKAIHATLEAAGLKASWNTYKSCLQRIRKSSSNAAPVRSATSLDSAAGTMPSSGAGKTAEPAKHAERICAQSSPDAVVPVSGPTSGTTQVLEALHRAREVASSKDYGQIGRELYRQRQKEERARQRKEPS